MKYRLPILVSLSAITLLTLRAGPTFAHHSAAATYIHGKSVKIEGTLKEFIWRNPHSFMKVQAPDEKGEMQMWDRLLLLVVERPSDGFKWQGPANALQ